MDDSNIVFKATIDGLILIMKEEDDFETVLKLIEKKLSSTGKFFKDASISVRYRGKKLTVQEEEKIAALMSEKTGAEIKGFKEDISEKIKKTFFNGIDEGLTKFYRGTVRSGQLINFAGNLVIIGDVNPGGEIRAAGNIIVLGTLRGMVHAGADGNKAAFVIALNLQPTQLRIADIITRSPDEKEGRGHNTPELAYIKDDTVYTEKFLSN